MAIQRLTLVANKAWQLLNAKSVPSWVQVQPTAGVATDSEGAIVNVTVGGGYSNVAPRTATLTFALTDDQTKTAVVTVRQNGAAPTISATPSTLTFNADGSPVAQG